MKILRASFITCLILAFIVAGAAALSPMHASQQPRVQAPAPETCEQAMRENAAYRDRIASLERQIDTSEETAKTIYLRAATWQDAYFYAIRLSNDYRAQLSDERARVRQLERDLADLRARARSPRRRR